MAAFCIRGLAAVFDVAAGEFFLFRHGENHSILNQFSDVSSVAADRTERNLHFLQKNRFSRLTVFFRWLPC